MHLPVYRIEQDDCRYGISLSRQTITRWIINASRDLLSPVVAKMKERLDKCLYHQGDETKHRATLDENNPTYSDKLKYAISYSKNKEAYLRKFLADGNIPIDNGASERSIKPIACHRKNSLFSYSIEGAESTMTLMSIIETAKENGAVPYYYLKYLLERMSKVVYYGHYCDMEEMMPWSVEYKQYEVTEKELIKSSGVPPGNERTETPKKKRALKERTA